MPAPVLPLDPAAPDPAALGRAAGVMRAGGLVAFPTETVYGLGANLLDPAAVARVFAAKGRPAANPLIAHIADPGDLGTVAVGWPPAADRLLAAFWPGPLTLVVPTRPDLPAGVTGGGPTVAVRCPAHPVARALIRELGGPVAAPSANRSGELSPTTAAHVLAGLGDRIDLILDGGPCPGGLESTVAAVTDAGVRILRPGLVTATMLEAVVGPLLAGAAEPAGGPLPSPGLLSRHYAPRTPLEIAESAEEAGFLADLYTTAGLRVGRWDPAGGPAEVAARLYADLHRLDAGGFDRIIAALPPAGPAWAAVRDRLTRAAAE